MAEQKKKGFCRRRFYCSRMWQKLIIEDFCSLQRYLVSFCRRLAVEKETIRQKVTVRARPIEAYEAFVDAKKHSAFTGSRATGEGKVGKEFTAWDGYISGKFLELEKGKKIVQEWITTKWPKGYPPSRFELTFKEAKAGTEVTMVHSAVPAEQARELKEEERSV
jgi:activator of HSP90 ATPase